MNVKVKAEVKSDGKPNIVDQVGQRLTDILQLLHHEGEKAFHEVNRRVRDVQTLMKHGTIPQYKLISADDIRAEPIEWLWKIILCLENSIYLPDRPNPGSLERRSI
jgi:hypothetical protein